MAGKDYKLDLLRGCPLFRGLSKKDLELVGRLADEIDVPAGKMLIKQGTSGHEFFIVIEGALGVERDGVRIRTLGPGDFAGEIALIDGGVRTASVTADTAARLLVVGHREFFSLLEEYPNIQIQVLQALAHRVRVSDPSGIH
ncbi:MAG TPA: cyclic nucleotide-binding domain-containing protein [Patescibacteria group bacterium]|nr:cyclic nucleotide-binding domain-containing protein [Patescibacteria group bacterium]